MNQSRHKKEVRDLAQFLARAKISIFPGHQVPANTDFQVCITHPVKGIQNYEGVCFDCKCPVWFADNDHPHLKKLCVPCFLVRTKTEQVKVVGNEFSLDIADSIQKRN